MCSRPSRSLNNTVTALMRFSSVKYLSRCSRIMSAESRLLRCSFASRFSSSSSSYDSSKKFLSSLDMDLLDWIALHGAEFTRTNRVSAKPPPRQSKVVMGDIKSSYGEVASVERQVWRGRPRPRPLTLQVWVGRSCPTPLASTGHRSKHILQ